MRQLFKTTRGRFLWPLLSLAAPGVLPAVTVVTTFSPIRIDNQSGAVSVNLNASLGPALDSVDDLEFLVSDLGGSSFLTVLGLSDSQVAASGGDVSNLAVLFTEGDSVGPDAVYTGGETELASDISFSFDPNFVLSDGEWGGGASGYIGLSFQIEEQTHYGFVRVVWSPDNDASDTSSFAVIDKIGYNTVAGEAAIIPEPSSAVLGLLALVPLALIRRR